MSRRHDEVWYSLAALAAATAAYLFVYRAQAELPPASSFVGHGLGVAGVVLMLMAETLYSLRKQAAHATWGSMAGWLRFHIVTGVVGPYMVLLHSAMTFRGIAGVTMLLTGAVVLSGGVGRYLYAALPRAAGPSPTGGGDGGGAGLGAGRRALATWHAVHVPLTWVLFAFALVHGVAALFYGTLQR